MQKVIAAKTAKGWWNDHRANTMRYAMGDVQHGPHLLRISKELARTNATAEEVVATWEEFMNMGGTGPVRFEALAEDGPPVGERECH